MDIHIRTDPTLDEYYRLHLLAAGRDGWLEYAAPAAQLMILFLLTAAMIFILVDRFVLEELLLFLVAIFVVGIAFVFQFIVFPLRIRRHYRQLIRLSGQPEYRFTDAGVACKESFRESDIPWEKFVRWMDDESILVLFLTDSLIHLIPKRCFSNGQLLEIRRALDRAKIPFRQVRRLGTLLTIAAAPVILLSEILYVAARIPNLFLRSRAGY